MVMFLVSSSNEMSTSASESTLKGYGAASEDMKKSF